MYKNNARFEAPIGSKQPDPYRFLAIMSLFFSFHFNEILISVVSSELFSFHYNFHYFNFQLW